MYIKAAPAANFLFHNCQCSQGQVHLVQSPSSFTVCRHQIFLSVRYTQVVAQALQMHFVKVLLFSFDDEWVMGFERGQEPWITKPVYSEVAVGKV